MADGGQRRLVTPLARLSYPAVIDPKPVMNDPKTKRYGAELLIEPTDLAKFKLMGPDGFEMVDIRAICATVAREEWGDDFDVEAKKKVPTNQGGLGWPLKDGNAFAARREAEGKASDHYKGKVYIRTKGAESFPPILKFLTADKAFKILERSTDLDVIRDYFTAGNYVLAEITAKAVETPAKEKFVTFYLNGVCYIRKGERLGSGGSLLDERLDGILGGISDLDPTEGMEDAIPL